MEPALARSVPAHAAQTALKQTARVGSAELLPMAEGGAIIAHRCLWCVNYLTHRLAWQTRAGNCCSSTETSAGLFVCTEDLSFSASWTAGTYSSSTVLNSAGRMI